jgi:H+-transporting ATPase
MKRMTLVHERDSHGEDFYRLGAATGSSVPENEGNHSNPKAKDLGTRDSVKDAKNEKGEGNGEQEKNRDRQQDLISKDEGGVEIKQAESADGDKPHSA